MGVQKRVGMRCRSIDCLDIAPQGSFGYCDRHTTRCQHCPAVALPGNNGFCAKHRNQLCEHNATADPEIRHLTLSGGHFLSLLAAAATDNQDVETVAHNALEEHTKSQRKWQADAAARQLITNQNTAGMTGRETEPRTKRTAFEMERSSEYSEHIVARREKANKLMRLALLLCSGAQKAQKTADTRTLFWEHKMVQSHVGTPPIAAELVLDTSSPAC